VVGGLKNPLSLVNKCTSPFSFVVILYCIMQQQLQLVGCCHGSTIYSNVNNSKIIVSMDDAVCIKTESLSFVVGLFWLYDR
jgi:hypothetical protein